MKKMLRQIYLNRQFALFIFLFAYVQSIHLRIIIRKEINIYVFTPDAAIAKLIAASILFLVIRFFIKYWQKSDFISMKVMLKIFGSSIIAYLFIIQFIGFVIAFLFNNIERNFNRETFMLSTFSYLLDGFIYCSFFLTYYYFHQNNKKQEQLVLSNQALSESKINQLKVQLNPHFLFNNLNVLDQLIEEDKNQASEFLNEFAEIYRYVLQASDKKFITIQEELFFASQYFKLIQHKYGSAYQLTIENQDCNGYIVPLTLQLLIENAVQHNLGTIANPVCIQINTQGKLCISNNYIPKRNKKTVSGRALNNLKEQYKLLTSMPIKINKTDNTFSVIIPIIDL
ncbi:histidine kinase [Flavobacterium sp. F-65]|uniref:Histidine kinase n=1 Tax=Flavobacterium pisciphilum TaxID=2893755 RepID=A0ABS8N055_9FLAO|nr:sensor histidine kinase [Flavobacterium sp. F-65]MCC9074423.1 histidine kinase [Flavobacterium sp. F-65]